MAPLQRGPAGSGALNVEENITLDDVAEVRQIVSDVWGFDIGGFTKSPAEDEREDLGKHWIGTSVTIPPCEVRAYINTEGNTIRESKTVTTSSPLTNRLGALISLVRPL